MPFISENELERALVKAVKNPAMAPEFYRLLLASDLLVMGTVEGQEDATEQFTLAPGGRVNLVTGLKDGGTFLPVFSSLLRMQEYARKECKYLSVNGRALLELTRGAPMVLNPASEFGKELTAQQVDYLLDPIAAQNRVLPNIGQAEFPAALAQTLTEVFATRPDVQAAWVMQLAVPERGQTHQLVGIETAGDWPSLMEAIKAAADRTLPPEMMFDLQRIDRRNPTGLANTLLQVAPFYQRQGGPALN
ncbi:MAG TPA: enhanced serine sensitivity protein SseB C-terminal domain-containing protein [Rhizomicrobium sp.]|jgi:hypothetical protein|nr:enhanced serine sensitivity protein SseB C-terminal domain-containing protein [Rhizomicrobium sp.]